MGILTYWIQSPLFNLLFGYGIAYSVEIVGLYAHNDWLELLSNCGILGVLLYSFVYIFWIKVTSKSLTVQSIFIISFVSSLYSMWLYSDSSIITVATMGIIIGRLDRKKNIQ